LLHWPLPSPVCCCFFVHCLSRHTNRSPATHTHPDRLPRSTSLWSVFVKLRPTSKLIKRFYHDLGTNWMIWHTTTPLSGKASEHLNCL
jgi:hypothetical protein